MFVRDLQMSKRASVKNKKPAGVERFTTLKFQ